MILVLLGTNPYSFERLARAVDELAGRRGWEFFIQTGNTPYQPRHCRFAPFLPGEDIRRMVSECELMITQGGVGSIREGLVAEKSLIAVPRLPSLGESQDNQEELVRALEQQGRILAVYDITDLEPTIERARTFKPTVVRDNRIPQIIREYLARL